MSRMNGSVLLVGSVPGETAAEVLRTCGEGVGKYVSCLPDGETGCRRVWIQFLAATIYHGHPALETIQKPKPIDGKETWFPRDYGEESWLFKVKDGIETVYFNHLGYANEAKKSYQDFCTLRAAGVIPPGVKFQVSLPLTESATRAFLTNARDFAVMWSAYEEAMRREITEMVKTIPVDDLAIQWDICVEVLTIELQEVCRVLRTMAPQFCTRKTCRMGWWLRIGCVSSTPLRICNRQACRREAAVPNLPMKLIPARYAVWRSLSPRR
jgi:hypothetical protein